MPLIIPDDIERFTTPGEEAFCRFLSTVAKPDDRYIGWGGAATKADVSRVRMDSGTPR